MIELQRPVWDETTESEPPEVLLLTLLSSLRPWVTGPNPSTCITRPPDSRGRARSLAACCSVHLNSSILHSSIQAGNCPGFWRTGFRERFGSDVRSSKSEDMGTRAVVIGAGGVLSDHSAHACSPLRLDCCWLFLDHGAKSHPVEASSHLRPV